MTFLRTALGASLFLMPLAVMAERPYVNDKQVPETRKDLDVIQSSVIKALPRARAATVCIQLKEGSGTGVVVSPEGLVLTAAHVSAGVGQKVKLLFEDGTEAEAKTLGLDSERDAAMVQITSPERKDWPFVEIDRKDSSKLGDWVFALGHSGGFDKERGVVVRVARLIKMTESTFFSDCILIGGDSGGPLFDLSGNLVGIHSRVGQALQENMHVPMNVFIEVWEPMLKGEFLGEGPFAKAPVKGSGYLGLGTEARAEGGIVVTKIGKDSPAEKAGMKVGDVLFKANDKALAKREDLQALLKEMASGESVVFELQRDGQPQTLTVELGER